MSNNNNHPLDKAPWLHVIISMGLGSGFFPGAPGTFAGFIALAIWYALYLVLFPTTLFWVIFTLIVITTFVGVWTSNVMENIGEQTRVQLLLTNTLVHGFPYWLLLLQNILGYLQ